MSRKAPKLQKLDPTQKSGLVLSFEERLADKIVGQPEAVEQMVRMYQTYTAGLAPVGRPIAVMLFAGITGSGKTFTVEKSAELLFGSPRAYTKIDCAEFQHSHEISKLLGSPPGYIGHKETTAALAQERIDQYQTDKLRVNFILFDEIEKANSALWQLMLGIMDKGTCTLGDGKTTDFSQSVIFMTTNLGAKEMERMLLGNSIGLVQQKAPQGVIHSAATAAIKKAFSPEFVNRIDSIVVFNTLTRDHFAKIVKLELMHVQNLILGSSSRNVPLFILKSTDAAEGFLVDRGTDTQYGARNLKRIVQEEVVLPLANLIASGQISQQDIVVVDYTSGSHLDFHRES